jgi:hypothetical protein
MAITYMVVLGLEAVTAFSLGVLFLKEGSSRPEASRNGFDFGWNRSVANQIVVRAAVNIHSISQERRS